jgi:SAM-dependent methyltransferase
MSTPVQPDEIESWFATPLGSYVLQREQAYFDRIVADRFGYNALQLGMRQPDFLRASRMPLRCRVATSGPVDLRADPRDLPIASNSIDLVLLPHVLEFDQHPHQILREVHRVLMPEGNVLISSFNPWSLWGFRRAVARGSAYPWSGRFISLMRMKDWLTLLGLEVVAGQMSCYAPPFRQEKWLQRFHFMEAAGDRWWPIAGGVYFLQAVKRVRGLRLIMPKWSDRLAQSKALATAPKKVRDREAIAAREMNGHD